MAGLQHLLAVYGYAALLPLAIIEGPAVTVFAAFLAAQGLLDLGVVYAIVVAGDMVGDVMYYAIGRWLLRTLVEHCGARIGPWAARIRQRVWLLAPRIRARAGTMLLFGKLTHSAGFVVLLAAGAAHVPPRRFLLFNLLGTLPKSLALVMLGYWFGWLFTRLQGDLRIAAAVGFVLTGAALALGARRLLAGPDHRGA